MTQRPRRSWSASLYYALWIVVVAVSVHDGYLVVLNRWTIARDERNPLGRWLIASTAGDVRLLLSVKLLGTLIVAAILLVLYWRQPRLAWIVCPALAMAQACLLFYLTNF